ncbi:4'-phosphopantetheinyl transferase family protein [Streptomyces exfoliatus]|uniref:4'-phosphopantetheinyl transferase family protein n=1 Tax=Streptomyces exfoliatus TaxID=1905 RepID=UPI003C2AEB9E
MREDVELWLVRTGETGEPPAAAEVAVLDAAERRRAASFRRPAQAALYVSAHAALRHLLGERLGVLPADVPLRREAGGRPVVAGQAAVHFSLSHSGDLALVGLAGRPVGVDVQLVPGVTTAELCGRRLHPAERAELAARPPADRAEGFARLWARKEAYLKGLGTGLRRALDADYLGDGGPGRPGRPTGWTVLDVPCAPGHAAAVALADLPGAAVPAAA